MHFSQNGRKTVISPIKKILIVKVWTQSYTYQLKTYCKSFTSSLHLFVFRCTKQFSVNISSIVYLYIYLIVHRRKYSDVGEIRKWKYKEKLFPTQRIHLSSKQALARTLPAPCLVIVYSIPSRCNSLFRLKDTHS